MLNEVKSSKAGKKIIVIIFLFITVTASSQNIPDDDTTTRPAITAIGKPDGKIAEKMMNKDGGTVVSSDGTLELIIPPGALSKKTSISIQPETNLMPNGNGKAYHLEPSGIQFQKPVQLIFHYDPEESGSSAQLLMGIAMQDDNGQWYGLNKFILDTVAKTISGNINHFSRWATFDKLNLINGNVKRLKVSKNNILYISGVDNISQEDRERMIKKSKELKEAFEIIDRSLKFDELSPLKNWKPPQKGIWRVNGKIQGNTIVGTLKYGAVDENKLYDNTYTAPAKVPDENPVTISVDLVGASFEINGMTITNLNLNTQILIYDNAYEVFLYSSYTAAAGTQLGNVKYLDDGYFIVSLNGKDTKIIEKLNKKALANWDYNDGKCTIKPLGEGHGNIHVIGASSINVIPSQSPGQPATVIIKFIPTPVILPLLEFNCPNPKGGPTISTNAIGTAMIGGMMPAFPIEIRFKAIEGQQVIQEFGKPGDPIFFKCYVKQLKDD